MSKEKQFKSVLAPYIQSFLEEYSQKGFKLESRKNNLVSIDEYLYSIGWKTTSVSEEVYQNWIASMEGLNRLTIYGRACSTIRLFEYMNKIGCYCPIPRPPKYPGCVYIPYIFSHEEITRIFTAADEWRDHALHPDHCVLVIPAILRLLYSTGMRVGETVAINNRDVDFQRHVIHIPWTKNNSERFAPINSSLEIVLKQYIHYRNKMPLMHVADPDRPFFVTQRGDRCHIGNIRYRFHLILDKAGIPLTSNGRRARVHDLRHTACVHAMTKMAKAGKDIYCTLPILATFMGHLHVKDTEYYVKFTRDMYPEFIQLHMSFSLSLWTISSEKEEAASIPSEPIGIRLRSCLII